MKRLYRWACKRWGPRGLTFSAWAWQHFAATGNSFWRDRFDGLFLLLVGQREHCQRQWQRETRGY